MDEQRLLGILIIAGTIFLAIVVAVWLRGHLERRQGKGRHRGKTVVHQEPEPGSFTAAVLDAELAVRNYQDAVFMGNERTLRDAWWQVMHTGERLLHHMKAREQAAKESPYASESGDVTVSSSATGGAPHGEDHRPKHR